LPLESGVDKMNGAAADRPGSAAASRKDLFFSSLSRLWPLHFEHLKSHKSLVHLSGPSGSIILDISKTLPADWILL